jgi:hypothetical protein
MPAAKTVTATTVIAVVKRRYGRKLGKLGPLSVSVRSLRGVHSRVREGHDNERCNGTLFAGPAGLEKDIVLTTVLPEAQFAAALALSSISFYFAGAKK